MFVRLLVCAGVLVGCLSSESKNLVGVWGWEEGNYRIRLTFGADNRFLREATVQGTTVVTQGRYRVEYHLLVFDEMREGLAGEPNIPVKGTIKVPFEWRNGFLVLNPHTLREQRFRKVSAKD